MNNGNKSDTNEYNNELMECIKNVAKEMAHSLIKTNYNHDDNSSEHTSGQIIDKRKIILDLEKHENVIPSDKRNKPNNYIDNMNDKQINVAKFDNKDNFENNDYNDLFRDDYNFKKVTNSMNMDFYERKVEGKLKKEKKLEMLRNKKKEEDLSHIKNKPKINKLSQKINENKNNDFKPIQKRVQEIVEKKYLKIDKMKQIYREIADTECSKITSSTIYDEKKFDDWLSKQSKWDSNKKSKIENAKQDHERLETENMKSMYHPNIDKKSEILMKSKILTSESSKNKESVYNKLYNLKDEKYNKINQRLVDSIPTFTPITNKHVPDFNKAKNCKNNSKIQNKETNYNGNHYNSVEFGNNFDVNYDDNHRNDGNYGSAKNKGLNTSMIITQNYNIKNYNAENVEEEVPDIISRYREALEMNKKTNYFDKNSSKKAIKKGHNRSYQEESTNKYQIRQNSIVKTNKKQPNDKKQELDNDNLLYKINVRNTSAWNKNKENCIIYNPQISNKKISLIKHSAK